MLSSTSFYGGANSGSSTGFSGGGSPIIKYNPDIHVQKIYVLGMTWIFMVIILDM